MVIFEEPVQARAHKMNSPPQTASEGHAAGETMVGALSLSAATPPPAGRRHCSNRVQFKVRIIPDLVDTSGIQNFEKTATNFTKGFIFTRAWAPSGHRGDRRFRGIRGVLNSLTCTSDYTRSNHHENQYDN
jgi:hypothetical protein